MEQLNRSHSDIDRTWATAVSNTWIRELAEAFAHHYPRDGNFVVFGGRPCDTGEVVTAAPNAIAGWRRWEFMYDIAVCGTAKTRAANASEIVEYLASAAWLVESEFSRNGVEVAKDIGKLRVSAAAARLLVARRAAMKKPQEWVDFIGRLADGMGKDTYVALMPTYASGASTRKEARQWRDCQVTIDLYLCSGDPACQRENIGTIIQGQGIRPPGGGVR